MHALHIARALTEDKHAPLLLHIRSLLLDRARLDRHTHIHKLIFHTGITSNEMADLGATQALTAETVRPSLITLTTLITITSPLSPPDLAYPFPKMPRPIHPMIHLGLSRTSTPPSPPTYRPSLLSLMAYADTTKTTPTTVRKRLTKSLSLGIITTTTVHPLGIITTTTVHPLGIITTTTVHPRHGTLSEPSSKYGRVPTGLHPGP